MYQYRIHLESLRITMCQLERIQLCEKAITQALERRNLDKRYKIKIQLNPIYWLEEIKPSNDQP